MKLKNQIIFQYEKHLKLLAYTPIHFVKLAMKKKLIAIKLFQDKENLINLIWKRCAMVFVMMVKSKIIREKTLYIQEYLQKNSWMTFLDNLNSLNLNEKNTCYMNLFLILLQELISKEKDYLPYWTPAYQKLSENLLSPIVIDSVDLDMNSSSLLLKKAEVISPSLMMKNVNLLNKNYQKTYYQLFTSTVAGKWEKKAIKLEPQIKSLKIPLQLNKEQIKIISDWTNTSRYIYNKGLEFINNNHKANWRELRDLFITNNTKKNTKEYKSFDDDFNKLKLEKKNLYKLINQNQKTYNKIENDIIYIDININNLFEQLNKLTGFTSKVKQLLDDIYLNTIKKNNLFKLLEKNKSDNNIYKTKIDNINIQLEQLNNKRRETVKQIQAEKNNNIYEWEHNTPKDVRVSAIKEVCDAYKTCCSNLKAKNIKFFKLKYRKKKENKCVSIPKNLISIIDDKIKIAPTYFKENNTIQINKKTLKKNKDIKIEHDCKIVKQNKKYFILIPITIIKEKNSEFINYCGIDPGIRSFQTVFGNNNCSVYDINIDKIKNLNKELIELKKNKKRKIALMKRENKKANIINEIHWKCINDILDNNDVIFYGDIKSHDITKNTNNKNLKINLSDLKFYKFKTRLLYKAEIKNKKVLMVNENFTTQTCSFCGNINKPGCSKIYNCINCKNKIDRDINAAKNILMKGIITYL